MEEKALGKDGLQFLAICFWHFSLVSFLLLAQSLARSAASLFCLIYCFFRAVGCVCVAGHVEEQDAESWVHWSWASYLLCKKGFLTTLVDIIFFKETKFSDSASSLGPQPQRHSMSVGPGISFSLKNNQAENSQTVIPNALGTEVHIPSLALLGR